MIHAGWYVTVRPQGEASKIPQMCQQVDGGIKFNTAEMFEQATRELDTFHEAHRLKIVQEVGQKERKKREELHCSLVKIYEGQDEHEKARRTQ